MLKYTDVHTMIHQKISRNKAVIAVHELKIELVNMLVEMQEKLKKHHVNTIEIYKEINEIEELQSVEYTTDREKKVSDLHISISADKIQEEIVDTYRDDAQRIKNLINYQLDVITHLHNQLPKTGTATNYNIITNDPNQTCHSMAE
jgi:hypothetical protein